MMSEPIPYAGLRRERRLRRARSVSIAAVALALLLAGLAVMGILPRRERRAEVAARHEVEAGARIVEAVLPTQAPGVLELPLPGTIQAAEDTPIHARVNGYLREYLVDIGTPVRAGQVLAVIDTPELDQELGQARAGLMQARAALGQAQAAVEVALARAEEARAAVTHALAQHSQARADHQRALAHTQFARATADRWRRLEQQELVSRQDAEERQTAYESASASRAAAEANIDATQANVSVTRATADATAASVSAARANMAAAEANVSSHEANVQRLAALQGFQIIRAPFGGIITARSVDLGALVSAGNGDGHAPLFQLARMEELRIHVGVPQTFAPSIRVGQAAEVRVREFPGQAFTGTVARTAGALDPASRTLLTEVRLRNDGLRLRAGTYAQVVFRATVTRPPLLVPATALVIRADGPHVATVADDDTVHYRKVELGRDLGPTVEVTGGLTGSEWIVTNPGDGLSNGARVRRTGL